MAGCVSPGRPGLRPFDFVFLLRPPSLVPLWIFQLAGAKAASSGSGVSLHPILLSKDVFIGLASMTLLLGGAFILNQIRDVETDRLNRKLFYLAQGIVSIRAAWIELALVWAGAGVLAAFMPAEFRWIVVGGLALSITYSLPPVAAKARAPFDLVWNAAGFGLAATAAGWASVAPLSGALVAPAIAYATAVAAVIASTTIPDVPGDRALGLRTTAVVLGPRKTSGLVIFLLALAGVIGWWSRDLVAFLGPVLSLPLYVRAHRTGRRAHRLAASQMAVAAFALVAGFRSPVLIGLLACVYFGTRAYYRARFGMAYPGPGTP